MPLYEHFATFSMVLTDTACRAVPQRWLSFLFSRSALISRIPFDSAVDKELHRLVHYWQYVLKHVAFYCQLCFVHNRSWNFHSPWNTADIFIQLSAWHAQNGSIGTFSGYKRVPFRTNGTGFFASRCWAKRRHWREQSMTSITGNHSVALVTVHSIDELIIIDVASLMMCLLDTSTAVQKLMSAQLTIGVQIDATWRQFGSESIYNLLWVDFYRGCSAALCCRYCRSWLLFVAGKRWLQEHNCVVWERGDNVCSGRAVRPAAATQPRGSGLRPAQTRCGSGSRPRQSS